MRRRLALLMHTLDRLLIPTVAVVQGPAYGGGVGLVACCDIVLASEAAKFAMTEVRLGLIPAVISPYVINAIGARQARRYFLTGEVMDAATALRIGLVHEVMAPDALEARATAMMDGLLKLAPGAQAEAKELVFLCEGRGIDTDLRHATADRIAIPAHDAGGARRGAGIPGKARSVLAGGLGACFRKYWLPIGARSPAG